MQMFFDLQWSWICAKTTTVLPLVRASVWVTATETFVNANAMPISSVTFAMRVSLFLKLLLRCVSTGHCENDIMRITIILQKKTRVFLDRVRIMDSALLRLAASNACVCKASLD